MAAPEGRPAAWGRGPAGRLAAALASGLLLALALPPRPDPWLAWVGLVPLCLACRGVPPAFGALLGWVAGGLYALLSVYWVEGTMVRYGPLPVALAAAATLLLALYMGAYTAVWGGLAPGLLRRHRHTAPLWLGVAWALLEWLRTHLLGGFGWAHLGYTQVTTPAILQAADLGGVYGLSWLVVAVNGAVSLAVARLARPAPRPLEPALVGAVALLLAAAAYGEARLAALQAAPVRRWLPVALVQGNVPEGQKWDPARRRAILERHLDLTRKAAAAHPAVVVWPEASLPYLLQGSPSLALRLGAAARAAGGPLLLGGLWRDPDGRYRNSAFLVEAGGRVAGRYDKVHLVPFGEYVPLGRLLAFVRAITSQIGDFRPGSGPVLLQAAGEPLGCPICFEVTYPGLVRAFARAGATWLATITNDAWFGDSVAPRQHLYVAAMRCVEVRLPLARAANTGITAAIDADGRILAEAPRNTATWLAARLPLRRLPPTLYQRLGDRWLLGAAALWAAAEGLARRRRRGRGGPGVA